MNTANDYSHIVDYDLIISARSNSAALDELIRKNMKLVRYVVNKEVFTDDDHIRENAIAEGYLALTEAFMSFDVDKGTQFSTWATTNIHYRVLKAMHKQGLRVVPVTDWARKNLRRYESRIKQLLQAGLKRQTADNIFQKENGFSIHEMMELEVAQHSHHATNQDIDEIVNIGKPLQDEMEGRDTTKRTRELVYEAVRYAPQPELAAKLMQEKLKADFSMADCAKELNMTINSTKALQKKTMAHLRDYFSYHDIVIDDLL